MQGRLSQFPLRTVFELLAREEKSGVLVAAHAGARATFWFRAGTMVRAESQDVAGPDWRACLRSASSWQNGDFWFAQQAVAMPDEVGVPINELFSDYFYVRSDGDRQGDRHK
jgi:hypothetical protein